MIADGARKAFVLINDALPEGHLKAFFVYAHKAIPGLNRTNSSLLLQIWRQDPTEEQLVLELVYQKKVYVNTNTTTGLFYTVRIHSFGST